MPRPVLDGPRGHRQGRDQPRPPPHHALLRRSRGADAVHADHLPRLRVPGAARREEATHSLGPGRCRLRRRPPAVRQRREARQEHPPRDLALQPRRLVRRQSPQDRRTVRSRHTRPKRCCRQGRCLRPCPTRPALRLGRRRPRRRRLRLLRPHPSRLPRRRHPPPRIAQAQHTAGPPLPNPPPLAPGDLLFYGPHRNNITHVAIYTGGGRAIDAPHPGAVVRETSANTNSRTFQGATRPSATNTGTGGGR